MTIIMRECRKSFSTQHCQLKHGGRKEEDKDKGNDTDKTKTGQRVGHKNTKKDKRETRQDKTRQNKARQVKARQNNDTDGKDRG
jgi:hypothetical protein